MTGGGVVILLPLGALAPASGGFRVLRRNKTTPVGRQPRGLSLATGVRPCALWSMIRP